MNAPSQPFPLFILCSSRSGSTLLRYILDTHPQIGSPPEFHIGPLAAQLNYSYDLILNPANFKSKEQREQSIIMYVRNHIDQIMRHYCDSAGKAWWCEKSVYTIDHFELIKSLYPNARFICLYRNCLDQVRSAIEVLQRYDPSGRIYGFTPFLINTQPNTEAGLVDYWISKTTGIMDVETKYPQSCFRITYESLVERRESTFDALFDFIGLDWSPDLLEKVFKVHHQVGPGDPKIVNTASIHLNSVGRGKEINRARISVDRVKSINKIHQRLGYGKVKM